MKIVYLVGTRPEIIRSAFIIKKLSNDTGIDFKLVHTGQHYNYNLNDIFFNELEVPKPDTNLNIGSGLPSEQTAKMMIGLERFFIEYKPDIVAVFGDTNSSLAGTLAALKLRISLAHVEAGYRDFEMDIPEEINRKLIDSCANVLFPVSDLCYSNLKKEHVPGSIFNTGDPLYEVFEHISNKLSDTKVDVKLKQPSGDYIFMTMHRDINVDNPKNFKTILNSVSQFSRQKIIFPIHPRTKKQLDMLDYPLDKIKHINFIDPLSYAETIYVMKRAKLVITDSGGLQKEAFWCRVPCIILRNKTGWIEPVNYGVSFLTAISTSSICSVLDKVIRNEKQIRQLFKHCDNPYVKANISDTIIKLLKKYAGKGW